ncbi:MAG TPA: alpha/beta hydrolase [Thermoanaerobaculaceae bacterium]|nr:alpha/beta hydrolase [Thermoanaerobaculaceae bacterium]
MCRHDGASRLGRALAAAMAIAAPFSGPGRARAGEAPRLALAPCRVAGLQREVRCGTLEVFEDRAAARGRRIPLHVVVLPATGPAVAPDPLVYFSGGPGEAATREAAYVAQGWAAINACRDIVLVDARGTGQSNGLQCAATSAHRGLQGALDEFYPRATVRECRRELESRADLRLYTTSLAVDDVDEVRAALGIERWNVCGASYGTRVVQVYLRRHGEHVRTAMMWDVLPTGARMPLTFARDAQGALDALLARCARDAVCRAAFPDAAADLWRVLDRLGQQPAAVEARDPSTGAPVRFRLTRNGLAQTVRFMLYAPVTAALVPLQAHLAAHGDLAPLARSAAVYSDQLSDTIADGDYLSVTCSEDVPFFTAREAAAAAEGSFLGEFRARAQAGACAEWVRGEVPASFGERVRSDVPSLLISGELDPVTPPGNAAWVAAGLTHALSVVVPGGGHSLDGLDGAECVDAIFAAFVAAGRAEGLDTGCVRRMRPAPFALRDARPRETPIGRTVLARFAGVYRSGDGAAVEVRLVGGTLRMVDDYGFAEALTPAGPRRFIREGHPPGFLAAFDVAGDAIAAVTLTRPAGGRRRFAREVAVPGASR